ncbi:MAG: 4-phosphoerythronate dehydrogenase [Acidobacteria bacterium]|nr:4-phosphoerythronate dehydrogenase [Acidobacteriota bacterium]
MIIAADAAIPYREEAFAEFGNLRLFSATDLRPGDVRDADALIVRSVTPVNASLLEGSSIRFVAAASAGVDHVDQDYLRTRGIRFAYAAGCNADSVSEYIVTALHVIASRRNWKLKEKSIAVVGVGNVGSRVARKAQALEMEVLLCDPPLRDTTGDLSYRPFDEVLHADILTFHVPLSLKSPYPTRHMIDRKVLDRLSSKQYLINTSRGAVFDNQELKTALLEGRIEGAVLDVWEGEPQFDDSLLKLVDIGTPHIAGSAIDGKIRATEMTRDALCGFLGQSPSSDLTVFYPESRPVRPQSTTGNQEHILSVLLQAFDIMKVDENFRSLAGLSPERAAASFERMRTQNPLRPEFRHFAVDLDKRHIDLAETYAALGFQIRGIKEYAPIERRLA